jgi:hypothetical protein
MLLLLRQMPHKLLLTPPPPKQMRTKHCWMPPPLQLLQVRRFQTLLTQPWVTFLQELDQAPTLPFLSVLMAKC